jgi:4-diphosphocytidyl-2-C-methyl-D-erythritol kinase
MKALQNLRDLAAPAKLNLFLHVVGKRSDAYHLIESVFQLIDWQDTIHLALRSHAQISRADLYSSSVLPLDDLCTRTARALQQATGCTHGVHIELEKRIPAQAGMGGGSSDAATCLMGLNRLWSLGLSTDQLCHIGLQLGADVPFFLRGRNAWVSGIGEQIRPLETGVLSSEQHFVVLKPENGLSTPAIFAHPQLGRNTPHAIIAVFAENPYNFGRNDLQTVGELMEPQVLQALNILKASGLSPRMTGSGSAVFAPCPAGFQLDTRQIPASWQHRVCKALDVHPLAAL